MPCTSDINYERSALLHCSSGCSKADPRFEEHCNHLHMALSSHKGEEIVSMHQHKEIRSEHTSHAEQSEQTGTAIGSGLKTSRVEALSDGIFAVAMTLLVLDIKADVGNVPNPVAMLFNVQGINLFAYV